MRGCLAVLVLGIAFLFGFTWLVVPPVAEGLVRAGLQASGFEGDDLDVRIDAHPVRLLTGRADSVRIRARDARIGDLSAVQMDLTLLEVNLLSRSVTGVRGRLDGVEVRAVDGSTMPIASVDLDGPIERTSARLLVTPTALEGLVGRLLGAEHGMTPTDIRLVPPDEVSFRLSGFPVQGRLSVSEAGDLRLVVDFAGGLSIRVLSAEEVAPLRLSGLSTDTAGLVMLGTLDVTTLLP